MVLDEVQNIAPWISASHIWDPDICARVLLLASKAEVQEGRSFSGSFFPIVTAILASLKESPIGFSTSSEGDPS